MSAMFQFQFFRLIFVIVKKTYVNCLYYFDISADKNMWKKTLFSDKQKCVEREPIDKCFCKILVLLIVETIYFLLCLYSSMILE